MNIFEALRLSHDAMRTLLVQIRETSERKERDRLFFELYHELASHAAAEERWFYLPLIEHDSTLGQSRHGMAEHHEMDEIVEKMKKLESTTAAWVEQLGKLEHKVLHHLEDEEHAIFQLGGKVLTDAQKRELAKGYEEEYAKFRLGKLPVSSAESK